MKYDFAAVEKKWQDIWEEKKPYAAITNDPRPKFYGLIEFPYPSAAGLHVGHPRPFTAMDIVTRKKRMDGYNVIFPIGYDAFGLPTENYAIKNHIHPSPDQHLPPPESHKSPYESGTGSCRKEQGQQASWFHRNTDWYVPDR